MLSISIELEGSKTKKADEIHVTFWEASPLAVVEEVCFASIEEVCMPLTPIPSTFRSIRDCEIDVSKISFPTGNENGSMPTFHTA